MQYIFFVGKLQENVDTEISDHVEGYSTLSHIQ